MAVLPDVTQMAVRAALTDVIHLYCHAIDRRRWELLERCFHADATYQYAHIAGNWREFVGMAQAAINPLRISQHQTGNILFRFEGGHVLTETYFTAYHRVAGDAAASDLFPGTGRDQDIVMAGRYIDRFECRDGDWRIAHRTGVTDWRHDRNTADGGLSGLPESWRGRTTAEDPGCAVVV